jgi:hypothetical protein
VGQRAIWEAANCRHTRSCSRRPVRLSTASLPRRTDLVSTERPGRPTRRTRNTHRPCCRLTHSPLRARYESIPSLPSSGTPRDVPRSGTTSACRAECGRETFARGLIKCLGHSTARGESSRRAPLWSTGRAALRLPVNEEYGARSTAQARPAPGRRHSAGPPAVYGAAAGRHRVPSRSSPTLRSSRSGSHSPSTRWRGERAVQLIARVVALPPPHACPCGA